MACIGYSRMDGFLRMARWVLPLAALLWCMVFAVRVHALETVLIYDGASHEYIGPDIELNVAGNTLTGLSMPPIIMNDRTLVPARETFEALGAVVTWAEYTREVYIGYGGKLIVLKIDSQIANIDGTLDIMDVVPKIINDKTMIPLRFASEALGLEVSWDGINHIATVGESAQLPVTAVGLPQAPIGTQDMDLSQDVSTERIPEQQYPQTQITDVLLPADGTSVFTVLASSPITKVDSFALPGRIVLDFYNAEMSAARTTWVVDSASVETVRMAQNQTTPELITRVVLDMKLAAAYRVTISPDRTQVYVIFENNHISDVRFYSDGVSDYVDISLNSETPVNVFHMTKPDRVVIDVPYSTIASIFTQPVSGRYAYELRANQFETYTARVVLELTQRVQHSVTMNGPVITIAVTEPTFKNIGYDELTRTVTVQKGGQVFTASEVMHLDAYTAGRYILTLPVDLSGVIGHGEYLVSDEYLNSIGIKNNSHGQTEITLNEQRVLAVSVTDDANNVYIKLLEPREVYDRIVTIDPGHGGDDPGAMANGLNEKDVNLSIANKVMALLEQDGRIKAYATRIMDVSVDLSDRPRFGNAVGDLFISIHNNAAERNPNANGTETYYYDHEFEHLLWVSGKEVAEIMHRRLIDYLMSFERKVDYKDLAVTRESTIPAALLEIGFVTNPEEAAKLATEEYRQLAAQAIFDGIIEVFEKYTPPR